MDWKKGEEMWGEGDEGRGVGRVAWRKKSGKGRGRDGMLGYRVKGREKGARHVEEETGKEKDVGDEKRGYSDSYGE